MRAQLRGVGAAEAGAHEVLAVLEVVTPRRRAPQDVRVHRADVLPSFDVNGRLEHHLTLLVEGMLGVGSTRVFQHGEGRVQPQHLRLLQPQLEGVHVDDAGDVVDGPLGAVDVFDGELLDEEVVAEEVDDAFLVLPVDVGALAVLVVALKGQKLLVFLRRLLLQGQTSAGEASILHKHGHISYIGMHQTCHGVSVSV